MSTRYVIKHPVNGYFTEFKTVKTVPILNPLEGLVLHQGHAPLPKGAVIGYEDHKEPQFAGYLPAAARYGDEASALAHIGGDLPDFHGGKDAFAGCTIEAVND